MTFKPGIDGHRNSRGELLWLNICLQYVMRVLLSLLTVTFFFAIMDVANVHAVQCSKMLDGPVISFSALKHKVPRGEIPKVMKNLMTLLKNEGLNVGVSAQTVLSSGKPIESYLRYAAIYPDTGFDVTSKEHALLIQSSYLSEVSPERLIAFFSEIPEGIKGLSSNVSRIMLMQTSLFSNRSPLEVLDFYSSAGRTAYASKSFANLVILQAAYLLNTTVEEVSVVYRKIPFVSGLHTFSVGDESIRRAVVFSEIN